MGGGCGWGVDGGWLVVPEAGELSGLAEGAAGFGWGFSLLRLLGRVGFGVGGGGDAGGAEELGEHVDASGGRRPHHFNRKCFRFWWLKAGVGAGFYGAAAYFIEHGFEEEDEALGAGVDHSGVAEDGKLGGCVGQGDGRGGGGGGEHVDKRVGGGLVRGDGGSPVIPGNRACAWPRPAGCLTPRLSFGTITINFITTAGKARARGSVNGRLS